jgi:hypothetical protein
LRKGREGRAAALVHIAIAGGCAGGCAGGRGLLWKLVATASGARIETGETERKWGLGFH